MKNKARLTTLPAILISTAIFATASQAGEIYRWTDENGNVNYTDKPMAESSERVNIESRRTDPAAVQAQLQARLDRQARAADEAAEADAAEQTRQEKLAERKEREDKCATYRQQLTRLVQNRRIYRQGADGERDYLDEAQMAQARADAQSRVEEYCGS